MFFSPSEENLCATHAKAQHHWHLEQKYQQTVEFPFQEAEKIPEELGNWFKKTMRFGNAALQIALQKQLGQRWLAGCTVSSRLRSHSHPATAAGLLGWRAMERPSQGLRAELEQGWIQYCTHSLFPICANSIQGEVLLAGSGENSHLIQQTTFSIETVPGTADSSTGIPACLWRETAPQARAGLWKAPGL